MNTEEGYFQSFDGTEIFFRVWNQPSKNALVLIHGYGNHSGWYEPLVQRLSSLPFSIYAFDLRGQGRSKGRRVDAKSFDDYVSDVYAFLDFLEKTNRIQDPNPILFGHSLGGLIAVRSVLKKAKRFRALILSSPCFRLYGISWWPIARFLVSVLGCAAPTFVMSNLVKPRFLFHDARKMQEYLQDSLIERRVTSRLANLIVAACLKSDEMNAKFEIPVRVLASGDDHVVSIAATKKWFADVQAPTKSITIYPNLYHEIFNETHTDEPVKDLLNFLNLNLKR